MIDETLDARGLKCPLPILLAKRALKRVPRGGVLEVLATDRGVDADIVDLCELTGATLVALAIVPKHALAVVFGLVLLISAYLSSRLCMDEPGNGPPDSLAKLLCLDGALPTADGPIYYHVRGVPMGFGLMFLGRGRRTRQHVVLKPVRQANLNIFSLHKASNAVPLNNEHVLRKS